MDAIRPAILPLQRHGLLLIATLSALGCHAQSGPPPAHAGSPSELARYDKSRWVWVEAECSDGALELGQVGLDRELTLDLADDGRLTLILETELATEGCYASVEWAASQSAGANWRFEPRAQISLPPDAPCGALERAPVDGTLQILGDELVMVTHASAWCRGFDARFVYRRAEPKRPSAKQLVARYFGAFNRRDPAALAALFVDGGSLIEPFTRTDDGNYKRHEGRRAIAGWYASAFASTPWSALRLERIAQASSDGHLSAEWQYMDARLASPLRGRNLFVIAGGEIYETELQLVDDPQPLRETERATGGL